MSEEATIQVGKVSSTGEVDEMQVEILLDGGEKILRVAMNMENFARAITGDFKVPCRVTRRKDI